MNIDVLSDLFYKGFFVAVLVVWAVIGLSNYLQEDMEVEALAAQEAACASAALDFRATALCYADNSCMITGEDFRLQVHTDQYLKENCPDEWKASQEPTPTASVGEANPGLEVGP